MSKRFPNVKKDLIGKLLTFNMKHVGKNWLLISDFHEKMNNAKVILQFAQKIDIIKKTIAHKVYKSCLYGTRQAFQNKV